MTVSSVRWTVPDLNAAVSWCRKRNSQGIRCTLAVLGEHAADTLSAFRAVKENINCIRAIEANQLDASLSLKLTAVGAVFDQQVFREHTRTLFREATDRHTGFELDMEGKGLIDITVDTGIACIRIGHPVTLALQAYMNRTGKDLVNIVSAGITPRIVKGAYHGDYEEFELVQERFKALVEMVLPTGAAFLVATHDPELLEWLTSRLEDEKHRVEFGFLMGLSDRTKMEFTESGWAVSEYIPLGDEPGPYIARREHYLSALGEMGRSPAP
ncbi:MAG: proline dehydrogenase family protein [Methanomicrobiales archaeon]